MATGGKTVAEMGLKHLAEDHVGRAMDRLGKLVDHENPEIALEASQLIIHLARLRQPGEGLPVWGRGGVHIDIGSLFGGGIRGG